MFIISYLTVDRDGMGTIWDTTNKPVWDDKQNCFKEDDNNPDPNSMFTLIPKDRVNMILGQKWTVMDGVYHFVEAIDNFPMKKITVERDVIDATNDSGNIIHIEKVKEAYKVTIDESNKQYWVKGLLYCEGQKNLHLVREV